MSMIMALTNSPTIVLLEFAVDKLFTLCVWACTRGLRGRLHARCYTYSVQQMVQLHCRWLHRVLIIDHSVGGLRGPFQHPISKNSQLNPVSKNQYKHEYWD